MYFGMQSKTSTIMRYELEGMLKGNRGLASSQYHHGKTEEIHDNSVNTAGLRTESRTWDLQNMKQNC
jgi:hypothetical protein